jgi:hypothetical protein
MKADDLRQKEAAGKIACQLVGKGIDVLIDDRDERPGVKFKDADLVGIPHHGDKALTIGDKARSSRRHHRPLPDHPPGGTSSSSSGTGVPQASAHLLFLRVPCSAALSGTGYTPLLLASAFSSP